MHTTTIQRPLSIVGIGILFVAAFLATLAPSQAAAQAEPAARGPGSYVQLGGAASLYSNDYGQQKLIGGSIFLDSNLYRRIGVEVEARAFRFGENSGTRDITYLAGPRISLRPGSFRPYTKLLVGRGEFYFPFHYATGSYFVVAPGFGVDWRVAHGKVTIRVLDMELQMWPGFSFGEMRSPGISSGLALRVF